MVPEGGECGTRHKQQVLGLMRSCPALLSSFVGAVHWKGTARVAALGFVAFLPFSCVAHTGSRCLTLESSHVLS